MQNAMANVNNINDLTLMLIDFISYSEAEEIGPSEVRRQGADGKHMLADVLFRAEFLVEAAAPHLFASEMYSRINHK